MAADCAADIPPGPVLLQRPRRRCCCSWVTRPEAVEIPFPDGTRHGFALRYCEVKSGQAWASVVKDAGDDPDVTNGAEIVARARFLSEGEIRVDSVRLEQIEIFLLGGAGVGRVTKPGLPVARGTGDQPGAAPDDPGRGSGGLGQRSGQERPGGARFPSPGARNWRRKLSISRLGIVGGLSILGTTGIVRPVSAKAWTDTIEASMQVARRQVSPRWSCPPAGPRKRGCRACSACRRRPM